MTPRIYKTIRVIAPFTLAIVVVLFIYNIWSHGTIVDPGQATYKDKCSTCHGDNGEGIKVLVPPLRGADFASKNIDSLPCWLKFGLEHPIVVNGTTFDGIMYPFDTMQLDDIQIANLVNYMNKDFFNSNQRVNSGWVREHWKKCSR